VGDIDGLADSINDVGLHSAVVTPGLRLANG
jgi:hypothetical protein